MKSQHIHLIVTHGPAQHKLRAKMIKMEKKTTGANLTSLLYHSENNQQKIETRKKHGTAINIKICKSDLELIDYLANRFNVTRNWLISFLIESDIDEMLEVFDEKPRYELSIEADKEISRKGLPHDFKNKTWEWDVLQPAHEVFDPDKKGLKN